MDRTVRKVTITGASVMGESIPFNANVTLVQPVRMSMQFSAEGRMSDILRAAADVIDSNLAENDALRVTVRQEFDRSRAGEEPPVYEYASNGKKY